MTRHRKAPKVGHFAAALTASALFLIGCGGESEPSDAAAETTVQPETTTTTAAPATTSTTTTTTIATTTTETPEVSGEPEFNSDSRVTTVGIDSVNFGLTVTQAGAAARGEFVPVDEANATGECFLVRPAGGPLGVQLTVSLGTIERVDITTEDITTRSGAGVGSTEEELAELFGDSLTTEASETGGNQVIFTPSDDSDAQFRVIFETDGETVTSFRSGRVPQVLSTIPCA